jgi:anaerobic ribonucleoside-triphosphate reductase activating protein
MLLHGMVEDSCVNGPGHRVVVWFQGCNLGCSGCWNPDTHAFDTSKWVNVLEFVEKNLQPLSPDLEGITFSGGDPMQHFLDLEYIINWVKVNKPNWSIGMFTGYTYKEVMSGKWEYKIGYFMSSVYTEPGRTKWSRIEQGLDFAVMGRYNKLLPVNDPLVTTSNQELKLFSNRYTLADFPPQGV